MNYAIRAGREYVFCETLASVATLLEEAGNLPLEVFRISSREPKGADRGWLVVDGEGKEVQGARQILLAPLNRWEAKKLGLEYVEPAQGQPQVFA